MKTVYFVRHGESVVNDRSAQIFLGGEAPLSEKGKTQTRAIAERAMNLDFEALIASPFVRAHETAKAISERTGHAIDISDLFTECRHPSALEGMTIGDPELTRLHRAWHASIYGDGAPVGDGETFVMLMERARAALAYLDKRSEERILVVTHGMFLKCMMCRVIFDDELTPSELHRFVLATRTNNTGITLFRQEASAEADAEWEGSRWIIRAFNDHAHLG